MYICFNKKLSYRQETARHLRMSIYAAANWSCYSLNNADVVQLDCNLYGRIDSINYKALSTLATIVAEFGDCRRIRRQIQIVAEFGDYSRHSPVWTGLKNTSDVRG